MNHVYQQSTGIWTLPDSTTWTGYSGNGQWKNDPASQCVKDHGPLPRGWYTIGQLIADGGHLGPDVMELIPDPDNDMCDRGGFYLHGDSISDPGNASDGCIVMAHTIRMLVANSGCTRLEVIA